MNDTLSEQHCVCCDSNHIKLYKNTSFFKLPTMKCTNCSYHFLQFKKDNFDIKKYYSETYWPVFRNIHNKKKLDGIVDTVYLIKKLPKPLRNIIELTGVRRSLAYSQFNYISPYVKGKKLLELGSGEGFLLELFEKKGFNVFGIEPSKDNLSIIDKKLKNGKCVVGYIEDSFNLKKQFDIIVLSHVLEHVMDCKQALIGLKDLLTPDGIIFIEVPNCQNNQALEDSINTQPHIHHFTKTSLIQLIQKCGFSVVKIDTFKAEVITIPEHIKYVLKWFLKIDHYKKTDNITGNYLRIIIKLTESTN